MTDYTRHGGPYDRGSADAYYGREPRPHYFEGDTYKTPEVIPEPGSPEWNAYLHGYAECDVFKDWS